MGSPSPATDRHVDVEQAAERLQPAPPGIAPHAGTDGVEVEKLPPVGLLDDRLEPVARKGLRQIQQRAMECGDRQVVLRPGQITGIEMSRAVNAHPAKLLRGEPGHDDVDVTDLRCEAILRCRREVAQRRPGAAGEQGAPPASSLVKRPGTDHHHPLMQALHAPGADAMADPVTAQSETEELIVAGRSVLSRSKGSDGSLPLGVTCHPGTDFFSVLR